MFRSFVNKILLAPYYFVLKTRNFFYDQGVFKSKSYDIPIICIGNITVGGTGKTPHTEYFIEQLMAEHRIAVVSRGYGRKTKGFRIVETTSSPKDCGDEPLQIKRKFPNVAVVVDSNRIRAIDTLLALPEDQRPQLIILDDAFQHRAVKATVNILLIDYNRPVSKDMLMPFGRLRDLPEQKKRADIVIVTKCPCDPEIEERREWKEREGIRDNQLLFFSSIDYSAPLEVFETADRRYVYSKFALIITGIANPKPLLNYLKRSYKIDKSLKFSDHHYFNKLDIFRINRGSARYPKCVILTTEKDSQRLYTVSTLSEEVKKRMFYLPIKVTIYNDIYERSVIFKLNEICFGIDF